ncbi:unnamed protein product [Microthlaspi erraticum]|uniref:Uncharacterized protein n=1 Tax=Microthlaspi erraticum TaxID=1685480 RepID=A0A6D2KV48_9BRAS|nr:unnamed protein product [Microthlaspi erraticum]
MAKMSLVEKKNKSFQKANHLSLSPSSPISSNQSKHYFPFSLISNNELADPSSFWFSDSVSNIIDQRLQKCNNISGIIPVSSSLDSVGWFARDPNTLRRVGHIPVDRITQVVIKSAEKLFGRQLLKHQNLESYFEAKVPSLKEFTRTKAVTNTNVPTSILLGNVMQLLQRHEFHKNHGDWINTVKPAIDPVISSQLRDNTELTNEEIENLNVIRNEMRMAIGSLLKDDGILVIPTMPGVPPKLGSKEIMSEDYQNRASSLLSIASISGCCQVTVPLGHHEKCPVSVSFIGKHGGDRFLLDTVQTMCASLQEHSSIIADPKSIKKNITQEESAELAKEKGNQAFKEKQWQKAIGLYSEAVKLSENNATYYSNRAAAVIELLHILKSEDLCALRYCVFLRQLRVGVVSLAPPRVMTDVVGVEIKSALVSVAPPCSEGTRGRSLGQVAKCFCGLLLLLCSQRMWLSSSSRSFGFVGGEDPVGGQSSFLPVKIGSRICFRVLEMRLDRVVDSLFLSCWKRYSDLVLEPRLGWLSVDTETLRTVFVRASSSPLE